MNLTQLCVLIANEVLLAKLHLKLVELGLGERSNSLKKACVGKYFVGMFVSFVLISLWNEFNI